VPRHTICSLAGQFTAAGLVAREQVPWCVERAANRNLNAGHFRDRCFAASLANVTRIATWYAIRNIAVTSSGAPRIGLPPRSGSRVMMLLGFADLGSRGLPGIAKNRNSRPSGLVSADFAPGLSPVPSKRAGRSQRRLMYAISTRRACLPVAPGNLRPALFSCQARRINSSQRRASETSARTPRIPDRPSRSHCA
jgi:hypothetical protein